jgi:Glycosyltransferase like family
MIAFGISVTDPGTYERCARPGLALVNEPESIVLALQASESLARTYNAILEQAAGLEGLEALVLLHQDAEIVDPALCTKLRRALGDPQVALVGAVGTTGPDALAWWDGEVSWGSAALAQDGVHAPPDPRERSPRAVDTLYGFVLGLSPWAVRTLRFDEAIGPRHGCEADLCRQARAAGRTVLAIDLGVLHHHRLDLLGGDPEPWLAAHVRLAEKWEPGAADWKARARRAEAEAAAARLLVASRRLWADATTGVLDQRLRDVTATSSWRVTAPLRRLNARRRRRAAGAAR